MSKEGVVAFLDKILNDESFQAKLKADPGTALSDFDLTAEEIEAIRSGSQEQLEALGLDARLSKYGWF